MKISPFSKCIVWFLCLAWALTVAGQKQPNIQENGKQLPASANVDGKLSEWDGMLQAYNKATRIEYTIANDDKHVYLAIRSKDKNTTAKIIAGGISFVLNISGKNEFDGPALTFPATNSGYSLMPNGNVTSNFRVSTDSLAIRNAVMQLKEIKVLRFKGISDSLISIYNEFGVKAKMSYINETMIIELLIPFDHIGVPKAGPAAFSYNLRLNGVPVPRFPGGPPPPPMGAPAGRDPAPYILASEVKVPTDFWGRYSLYQN